MFRELDTNRNGAVEIQEFYAWLDRAFSAADINKDGRMDVTEFKLTAAAFHSPPHLLEEAFRLVDANGDGFATKEETAYFTDQFSPAA
ncbi:EF-hand domain pair domain-containing protein [Ditylenchus destructor]|uniref:EF-hand domain pair domain-containing protein n=1 Tax=Ditylenchus destructor TaxID=166010 RepID=A0AAD4N1G5_9BILA|nr:EF-hand domain pair domain-containing protein [Ditylenchus destructor]